MSRYSWMPLIFISFIVLGCNEDNRDKREHVANKPLSLHLEQRNERLVIYIINESVDKIPINRLFRVSGTSPEIKFIFDKKQAKFNSKLHAYIMPDDVSDATIVLKPEEVHGVFIEKSDVRGLFGIDEGTCSHVTVVYENTIDLPDVYKGELKSNTIKVCM